jgi:CreA protein
LIGSAGVILRDVGFTIFMDPDVLKRARSCCSVGLSSWTTTEPALTPWQLLTAMLGRHAARAAAPACAARKPRMRRHVVSSPRPKIVEPRPCRATARGFTMKKLLACVAAAAATTGLSAEQVGSVDTAFKLIGPDHKIVVDDYEDPRVAGVTCYVSRARTGGLKGAMGLAEDKAEASIACRQTGPVSFAKPLPLQEEVLSERQSILFKKLRVVRMVDKPRNTLVYLTYSDRLVEGSPQNSVTAVPVDRATVIPTH